ncbi:MAG: SpoIIE family protein phosphatase [Actinobacteria bacterium]|nr:SpoIIE family protein phosphatase [Actinomycetota bacterium]
MAILSSAAATGITLGLRTYIAPSIFPMYFAAVAVTAWYGGFAAALLAIAASAIAASALLLPEEGAWGAPTVAEIVQVGLFVVVALVISGLSEAVRTAERRARAARARADAAQERLAFLAEASTRLASSLDYEATLAGLARLAVPRLADWCVVDVLEEGGGLQRLAVAHVDPARETLVRDLHKRYPPDPASSRGPWNVIRTGHSELHPEIPDETLVASARDEDHLEILRELGLTSALVVPLSARGRTLGAMTLAMAESGRRYSEADLAMVEEVARRAGVAVDNARMFRDRSRIARTLQESLLPSRLPDVPGLDVAARYRPAGAGQDIGGDFYDVFPAGDAWGVVVGDVCGKGVDAAVLTSLTRHTIRVAAMRGEGPSGILRTLSDAILDQRSDQRFCTAVYAAVRPEGDGATVSLSCGGHPPPAVVRADGRVERVGIPGSLLGLFEDPDVVDVRTRLAPGDALVMFTDGVTDARPPAGTLDEAGLEDLLRRTAGADASGIAQAITTEAIGAHLGEPRDDIAVLVVRVPPAAG